MPQWEESAALHRDHAAKQAELAAAELAKLSSRMSQQRGTPGGEGGAHATASSSAPSSSGGGFWGGLRYLTDLLTSFLLNRLQLSVKNVHVYFKVGGWPGLRTK